MKRDTNSLRNTAINLAVHNHGIDQHATVLDDDVVENLDIAEFRIDRDGNGVGRITEGAAVALRLVAAGRLQSSGIDIRRQILPTPIPGMSHFLHADAA